MSDHLTWPDAFAIVASIFFFALFFGVLVTERWPWERRDK